MEIIKNVNKQKKNRDVLKVKAKQSMGNDIVGIEIPFSKIFYFFIKKHYYHNGKNELMIYFSVESKRSETYVIKFDQNLFKYIKDNFQTYFIANRNGKNSNNIESFVTVFVNEQLIDYKTVVEHNILILTSYYSELYVYDFKDEYYLQYKGKIYEVGSGIPLYDDGAWEF